MLSTKETAKAKPTRRRRAAKKVTEETSPADEVQPEAE